LSNTIHTGVIGPHNSPAQPAVEAWLPAQKTPAATWAKALAVFAFLLPPPQPSLAQQAEAAPSPRTPGLVLQTGTRLVVIDVVVLDHDGRPVRDLKRDDFLLTEDKQAQTVRNFDEHSTAHPPVAGPAVPAMPAGTFTDYTPVSPTGTLNVFLLDQLNTSVKDQTYALQQLQKFVDHAPAGTQIAIFGLASRLYLLKGFTADPQALQEVLRHKIRGSSSAFLDDAAGTNTEQATQSQITSEAAAPAPPSNAPTSTDLLVATLEQFEADTQAFQTQLRIQYTLDAFSNLGHYLGNFPGRKNLFWFSAAFPINILPNPSVANSFVGAENNADRFREVSDLLTRAQVSVYPVDARGLTAVPMYDASRSGNSFARSPNTVSAELNKFYTSQALEHQTMDALAESTGGHAFYNTNGIAEAVGKAMEDGANYYTLAYSPSDRNWAGQYRHIHVGLAGALAGRGLRLEYRQGYYADVPQPVNSAGATASADSGANQYARLAISHGAPAPSDIIFKVSVLPASTAPQESVAQGNRLDPASKLKGPFQTYVVEYAALPGNFALSSESDGRHRGKIEFSAFLFDTAGHLLNSAGSDVDLNLTPETYNAFLQDAVRFHLEISAPVHGESFLRLAIHDVPSNRFGVVEIPISSIPRKP